MSDTALIGAACVAAAALLALAARRYRTRWDQQAEAHVRDLAAPYDPDATELLDLTALTGSASDEAGWAMGETA
ncbi:hypothetical protein HII36_54420 [Nonomuraea sp. NN258]|uniref:hypothetical protein n=1 Tax=Nonomuraea antri TaxID=2730852 RepID=UPI0015694AE5|nr:hypothetical protein [Nonomuraea antri]NRQ40747.1 hypothetical protein [Nonomuraea antri]